MKNTRSKAIVKDERGYRWFLHKNGEPEPANWKQQCYLVSAKAHKDEVQQKLYGKKK